MTAYLPRLTTALGPVHSQGGLPAGIRRRDSRHHGPRSPRLSPRSRRRRCRPVRLLPGRGGRISDLIRRPVREPARLPRVHKTAAGVGTGCPIAHVGWPGLRGVRVFAPLPAPDPCATGIPGACICSPSTPPHPMDPARTACAEPCGPRLRCATSATETSRRQRHSPVETIETIKESSHVRRTRGQGRHHHRRRQGSRPGHRRALRPGRRHRRGVRHQRGRSPEGRREHPRRHRTYLRRP